MVPARPALSRTPSALANLPSPPVTAASMRDDESVYLDGILELVDGSAFGGISFGAEAKSVSGECVFQTGTLNSTLRRGVV